MNGRTPVQPSLTPCPIELHNSRRKSRTSAPAERALSNTQPITLSVHSVATADNGCRLAAHLDGLAAAPRAAWSLDRGNDAQRLICTLTPVDCSTLRIAADLFEFLAGRFAAARERRNTFAPLNPSRSLNRQKTIRNEPRRSHHEATRASKQSPPPCRHERDGIIPRWPCNGDLPWLFLRP